MTSVEMRDSSTRHSEMSASKGLLQIDPRAVIALQNSFLYRGSRADMNSLVKSVFRF